MAAEVGDPKKELSALVRQEGVLLDAYFDASPAGLVILDDRLRYVHVNESLARINGVTVQDHLGRTPTEVLPELAGTIEPLLQGVLDSGDALLGRELTGEVPAEPGTQRHWEISYFPIYGDGEHPIAVGGVIIDITKRKRAERDRLDLERQIQQTQKLESLGVLAGGIAHDFNNILTSILGNASLALSNLAPHAPARENIEQVEEASLRAAGLAQQMLAYSGKGRFVTERIDLSEFVREMTYLLEVSISKGATLNFQYADNLPTFDGDATQIRQVIMNVIINASEAIGDGSGVITLSTGAMQCDAEYLNSVSDLVSAAYDQPLAEGLYVYFEVSDTGSGMETETVERIFEPFFTTKFTGRGLGLSATLGIVVGHRGAVKIYSELGRGTTFKVLLPVSALGEGADELVDGPTDKPLGGPADDSATWTGSGTILIVDDEKFVRAVATKMVERLGFDVLLASDGRMALELFAEHHEQIACVLLDLTMPHLDGEEAFREIRRISPGAIVVLSSGYNMQDATQRFTGKGLAGFLAKPYNFTMMRQTLREILPPG